MKVICGIYCVKGGRESLGMRLGNAYVYHKSIWGFSTNLLFWSVFQTFTVTSEDAETVLLPSSVTATAFTAAEWPFIT